MNRFFVSLFVALMISGGAAGQDSTGSVRPAALAFAKTNPLTHEIYVRNAIAFMAVLAADEIFEGRGNSTSGEVPMRAREFYGLNVGLFAALSPEETLACLSWQSIDDVVKKHAQLAAKAKDVELPILSALVNLKFACMTEQEIESVSRGVRRRDVSGSDDRP